MNTTILLFGMAFVIFSGALFTYSGWVSMSDYFRSTMLCLVSVLLFITSWLSVCLIKNKVAGLVLYISGTILLPVAIILSGYMGFYGRWLSPAGQGFLILFAFSMALLCVILVIGSKIFHVSAFEKFFFAALSIVMFCVTYYISEANSGVILAAFFILYHIFPQSIIKRIHMEKLWFSVVIATVLCVIYAFLTHADLGVVLASSSLMIELFVASFRSDGLGFFCKVFGVIIPWCSIPMMYTADKLLTEWLGISWIQEMLFFYFVIIFSINTILLKNGNPPKIRRFEVPFQVGMYTYGFVMLIINRSVYDKTPTIVPYYPIYALLMTLFGLFSYYRDHQKYQRQPPSKNTVIFHDRTLALTATLSIYLSTDVFMASVPAYIKLIPPAAVSVIIMLLCEFGIINRPGRSTIYMKDISATIAHFFMYILMTDLIKDTRLPPFIGIVVILMQLCCQVYYYDRYGTLAAIFSIAPVLPSVLITMLRFGLGSQYILNGAALLLSIISVIVSRRYYQKVYDKRNNLEIRIDWYHICSVIPVIYVLLKGDYLWKLISVVLIAVYFGLYIGRVSYRAENYMKSGCVLTLCTACGLVAGSVSDRHMCFEIYGILPVLASVVLLSGIWRRRLVIADVLDICYSSVLILWTIYETTLYFVFGSMFSAGSILIFATLILISCIVLKTCIFENTAFLMISAGTSLLANAVLHSASVWIIIFAIGIFTMFYAIFRDHIKNTGNKFYKLIYREISTWRKPRREAETIEESKEILNSGVISKTIVYIPLSRSK